MNLFSRVSKKSLVVCAAVLTVSGLLLVDAAKVTAIGTLTPIEIDPRAPIAPVPATTQFAVTVSGSGPIAITSTPSGVVSYQTTVPAGTSIVTVPTQPTTADTVTVRLTTDGSSYVQTQVPVEH